jgi:membrane protein insertase Oxa1/YidC/SpoIIIJ
MGLFNILADASINVWGQTYNIYLNWIGKIIRWLIEGIGVVGVGIIVFSLLLKVVVLPFDVYQRITMRKQNVQMRENKEKMEIEKS